MNSADATCARAAESSLGDLVLVVAAAIRLGDDARSAERWSERERRAVVAALDRAVDGLTAVRAAVLVAERESGTWRSEGDRSFEAWRGRTGRTGQRSASAQVRQADHLAAVPAAVAAVTAGRIGVDHAATIGAVASTGTVAQRDAVHSPEGQAHLLRLAERLDAGTFASTVARWAATADPAGLERDHQAQRAERFFHVATTPHGTFLKGRLDSIAGHRLTSALEALTPRPAAEDERDPGQRRADALDAMCRRILALADTKPGGHVPPQVTMILTAETWAAARAERDRRRRAGSPRRAPSGDGSEVPAECEPATAGSADPMASTPDAVGPTASTPGQPAASAGDDVALVAPGSVQHPAPATLEDGTPVPTSELAIAMCDCEITRIVIDAEGVPLDLGRAERVFTGQQRRAVIARDRECAWPECRAHARWCEVHHIRWWERDNGRTSVDNGVLLCSYHHHEVHRRDLTITRVRRRRPDGRPADAGAGPEATIARVAYDFQDRTGRQTVLAAGERPVATKPDVGRERPTSHRWHASAPMAYSPDTASASRPLPPVAPASTPPRPAASAPPSMTRATPASAEPATPAPEQREGSASALPPEASPSASASTQRSRNARARVPDLEWATDPITGMKVPAFFLVP